MPKPPEDKSRNAVRWGTKIGMLAGFLLARIYINQNSPLGFYTGNVVLIYLLGIGPGAAIGAGMGWLYANKTDGVGSP